MKSGVKVKVIPLSSPLKKGDFGLLVPPFVKGGATVRSGGDTVDLDLDLDFDVVFVFVVAFVYVFVPVVVPAVGGGPRWARYEKSRFLYNKTPHFRLSEARLLRRAEFGSPTKNDFFHALRGVFFFSVPFLLDKQKKRYDFRLLKKKKIQFCR